MPVLYRIIVTNLLLFIFPVFVSGQKTLSGKVVDAATGDPLAFVNILMNSGPQGAVSDIDGKFTLKVPEGSHKLKVSYVGYQPVEIQPGGEDKIVIRLTKTQIELSEVTIRPGINPAHRIIRSAYENRFLNDHEHLNSFSYTVYEKTTFGPAHDTLPPPVNEADTGYVKMKAFFDRQHLFIMEAISERRYMFPGRNYNKVLASRVSGFSDPLFVYLISEVQSTSFYDDIIKINDRKYINPVSFGSWNKYFFQVEDTLVEPYPYDTTYIISYRPLRGTNFDGLRGTISISTHDFAIRNVIAEPAMNSGPFRVRIQQMYDWVNESRWFPVQLNTDLIFDNALKGNQIQISAGPGTPDSLRNPGETLVGKGKSYISDIRINPPLRRSDFGFVELDVLPDAHRKVEEFWNDFRSTPLTIKDSVTYARIDSLGQVHHFDRMGKQLDALLNGKIPIGKFDLMMDDLMKFNAWEWVRPGVGLRTGDRLSTFFRAGAYAGYGLRDHAFKYGGNLELVLNKPNQVLFRIQYANDLSEGGISTVFPLNLSIFNPGQYRTYMISRMDGVKYWKANLSSRIFNYWVVTGSLSASEKTPLYSYSYLVPLEHGIDSLKVFRSTEASLMLKFIYRERFLQNSRSILSMGSKFPVVWISYTHGFKGVAKGEYTYNRYDLDVSGSFFTKYIGTSSFSLQAGLIDRPLPYPLLYASRSSYRDFTIFSANSFATMRMGEFSTDKFVNLYLSHKFGKLLFQSKRFKPQPELITNMGFGSLKTDSNHNGLLVTGYPKGYFESGLLVNNILDFGLVRLGIGSIYRYGSYSLPRFRDNVAWKFTASFVF